MKITVRIFTLIFFFLLLSFHSPAQTLQLNYSSYLGGSADEYPRKIKLGTDGTVYLVGDTNSLDFCTRNPYQAVCGGAVDVFLSKFGSSGSTLIYSTYLGGSGEDHGHGIALGPGGEVYVTGDTYCDDFPTKNPYQGRRMGFDDAFVSKLGSSGSTLIYSTHLGGSDDNYGYGIALGPGGEVYLTGATNSLDFPTVSPYQPGAVGGIDVFISKLESSGSALIYSTYLGGIMSDSGNGIVLGSGGEVYVTGETYSPGFPTKNPYQGGLLGDNDAFVIKLDSSGSALYFSSFLGGNDREFGKDIALGSNAEAYITGWTFSSDFPTENPYQAGFKGVIDAFISKFGSSGSMLSFSSYLGGSSYDYGYGIVLDPEGGIYLTGETKSSDFPTEKPYQPNLRGGSDAFITHLDSSGSTLIYSTFLGGNGYDCGEGIVLENRRKVYVTGETDSYDFPTANPYQPALGGSLDAFVSKLVYSTSPPWIYDYNGDGISDIAIFRPSSGLWAIRGITRVYFGGPTDEAVPGDYNGDGTTDIVVFRESSGLWAERGGGRAYFGRTGDIPVPGDYDGSGTTRIAVFRESSGLWAARGLDWVYFGKMADIPVPGYYTGDRNMWIGVYRPATGLWAIRGVGRAYFGSGNDIPVPGDYDGNGVWEASIFRPDTGLWAIRGITRSYFGSSSDEPVPADYNGDSRDDIGIFRESSGLWAIRGVTRAYFGAPSDIPVTR